MTNPEKNADPRLVEAMRLHVMGALEEAEALYKALSAELPDNPDLLYNLGALAWQRGQAAEAMEYFAQALALKPQDERLSLQLAKAQEQCGMKAEALDTLEAALAAHPQSQPLFTTFFNLGADMDRLDQVLSRILKMLEDDPYNWMLHTLVVSLYEHLGRHAEKIPHMGLMLEADDARDEGFYMSYATALAQHRSKEAAQEVIEQGLSIHPGSPTLTAVKVQIG